MAYSARTKKPNVKMDELNKIALRKYNFFQLVEILYKLEDIDVCDTLNIQPNKEIIRFTSYAGLGFPPRDIIDVSVDEKGKHTLEVSFLGLQGTQSPLPTYYLESLAAEYLHQETKLIDFINLFNHRLIFFLHHIWRKYRYYINFKDGATDSFSNKLFSLIGLDHKQTREFLGIDASKVLANLGALVNSSRSRDVICRLVSQCFEIKDVSLDEWVFRYVDIPKDQQNRLGIMSRANGTGLKGRSCLGDNFTLGSRIQDRSGKFELQLNDLSRKQFLSFLPNGSNYKILSNFVSFILKDQFAWDLRLKMKPKQVTGIKLGDEKNAMLGWISFLGKPENNPNIKLSVRE